LAFAELRLFALVLEAMALEMALEVGILAISTLVQLEETLRR
jgi:hypothetical protein